MSVVVLGPGARPRWLESLPAPAPGEAAEAVVVINDLSGGVLDELSRAYRLRALQPAMAIGVLTLIGPGLAAEDAALGALPAGVSATVDPAFALGLLGARWRMHAGAHATTFEYQGTGPPR